MGRPTVAELTEVTYDVTVVHGTTGQRLAVIQAETILGVLIWIAEHP